MALYPPPCFILYDINSFDLNATVHASRSFHAKICQRRAGKSNLQSSIIREGTHRPFSPLNRAER